MMHKEVTALEFSFKNHQTTPSTKTQWPITTRAGRKQRKPKGRRRKGSRRSNRRRRCKLSVKTKTDLNTITTSIAYKSYIGISN
jgi:hypothetical protein